VPSAPDQISHEQRLFAAFTLMPSDGITTLVRNIPEGSLCLGLEALVADVIILLAAGHQQKQQGQNTTAR
jgi:hypothetical protein